MEGKDGLRRMMLILHIEVDIRQEVELCYTISSPAPCDSLPLVKFYLLKVPEPSKNSAAN